MHQPAVCDTLLRAGRQRGIRVPELAADFQHRAGTVDHNPESLEVFFADGKKTGHGIICSFSAATHAGRLAQKVIDEAAHPAGGRHDRLRRPSAGQRGPGDP